MNATWVQDGWSLLSVMLEPLLEPPRAETATELSVKQSDVYSPLICTHLRSSSPQHYTQEDLHTPPALLQPQSQAMSFLMPSAAIREARGQAEQTQSSHSLADEY